MANGAAPYHPPDHLFSDSLDGGDLEGRAEGQSHQASFRKGGALITTPYQRPKLPTTTTSFASLSGHVSNALGGVLDHNAVAIGGSVQPTIGHIIGGGGAGAGAGVMGVMGNTMGGGIALTPLKLPHTTTSASPLFSGMAGGQGLGDHMASGQGGGSTVVNPQLLNLRGVQQVWGKSPPPVPVVSTPATTTLPPTLLFTSASAASTSASASPVPSSHALASDSQVFSFPHHVSRIFPYFHTTFLVFSAF